jgi:hypothetical protein
VVLERFDQRLRLGRGAHALGLHQARHAAIGALARMAGCREQKPQEIPRRLARSERLLGKPHVELPLQAQDELHARQAVQSEIALERAVERHIRLDIRPRLARDRGNDAEHAVSVDGGGNLRYGGHCAPSVHSPACPY